ncbi:hypothetical protein XENOCAPTIV_000922 [Xenoophorus captivus]|uniref:Uncharacterized protein n=1 Tax=Xenoophorus captivus TaxID=1517983 RepID=A0ABV0QGX3_9TELE
MQDATSSNLARSHLDVMSSLGRSKDCDDKDNHGTVGLTVMSVAEWAGNGISTSVTNLALLTMTPCDVLIPSWLSLLMGLMVQRRSGRGTIRGYLRVCMALESGEEALLLLKHPQ